MADHPGAKQSTTGDRTGALVAGGLALLSVIGVVTVFSEAIAAAWSPVSSAPAAAEPAPGPAPPSAPPSLQATGAGGGATPP